MSAEEMPDSVLNTGTEDIWEYSSIFDAVTTGWTLEDHLTLVSEVQISYTACEPKEIDWEAIAEFVRHRKGQLLQIDPGYSKRAITSERTTAQECKDTYEQLMSAFDEPFQKAYKQQKNPNLPTVVTKRNLLFRRLLWERAQKAIINRKHIYKSLLDTQNSIINLESGPVEDTSPKGSDSESELSDDMDLENDDGLPLEERKIFIAQLARALCIDEGFSRIPVGGSLIIELPVVPQVDEGEEAAIQESNGNLQCQTTIEYKDLPPSNSMVSPELKQLVTTAISEAGEEDRTLSVASGISPTLSMLLEMPPRDRGQPLPRINSLMNVQTGALNHGTTLQQGSPVPSKGAEGFIEIECPSKSPEKKNDLEPRNEIRGIGGVPVLPLQTQEEIEIANDFVIESGLVPQTVESSGIDINGSLVYTGSDEISTVEAAQPLLISLEESDKIPSSSKYNLAQTLGPEPMEVEPTKSESVAEGEKISVAKTVCSVVSEISEATAKVAFSKGDEIVQSAAPSVPAEVTPATAALDTVVQDVKAVPVVLGEIQTDESAMETSDRTDKRTDESGLEHPDKSKGSPAKSPRKSAGEKVDNVSAPLTRNSAKDRHIKPEDNNLTKKANKEVVSLTPAVKRSVTRSAAVDDSKAEQKSIGEMPQKNSVGISRKSSLKQPPSELHAPVLRSRRGPTPTPATGTSSTEDLSGLINVSPVKQGNGKSQEPEKDRPIEESNSAKSVVDKEKSSPRKERIREKSLKSDEETEEQIEDDSSQVVSGLDEESGDNEDQVKKKQVSAGLRQDRSESGEMADDDNSNSAFDGLQKKRLTRRSGKFSPQKSEHKLRDEASTDRPREDSAKSRDLKSRRSKTMSRLKHLHEEASQVYGDIECKEESVHGKRITRARAKTSSSPGTKSKAFYSKRDNQADNDVSSETERGPSRATRSRASVGSALSHSAVESLPTALSVESNPSSPTSSVANSMTLDDEKDHRVFRKSIMLLYNELMNHKHSHLFLKSATEEDVKNYSKIVKFPMDLTTIKKNIELGACRTYASFERDVYLIFMNTMMFNSEDHPISLAARAMERDVDKIFKVYKNSHQDPTVKAAKDEPPLVKTEVDGPLETDEERKFKSTPPKETTSRKRRNLSLTLANAEETETKKRTLRTSTTAATTAASAWQGSRKAKNQVSPDIVSSSKAD